MTGWNRNDYSAVIAKKREKENKNKQRGDYINGTDSDKRNYDIDDTSGAATAE